MKKLPKTYATKSPNGTDLSPNTQSHGGDAMTRRDALKATLASVGAAALAFEPGSRRRRAEARPHRRGSPKLYDMPSRSILAFRIPSHESGANACNSPRTPGFDGIEFELRPRQRLSPKPAKEYQAIRRMADQIAFASSGLCSFLFWPYPLTAMM